MGMILCYRCLFLRIIVFFPGSETTFSVEELVGMILEHARHIAEVFAGKFDAWYALHKQNRMALSFFGLACLFHLLHMINILILITGCSFKQEAQGPGRSA